MNRKRGGLEDARRGMRFVLRPVFRTTIAVLALAWRTSKNMVGRKRFASAHLQRESDIVID